MSADIKNRIISAVHSFPAISPAATRLLQVLNPDDDTTSAGQLEEIVRYDPGLTANVLKMANSAYFGLRGRVSSITQAVTLLGRRRLLQLVIASSVNSIMANRIHGYGLARGQLWRHSIAVAVASEILIAEHKIADSDEAFTAALLHDIGKLILGEFVHADLRAIDRATAAGDSFVEAEREVLGVDHCQVAAWVLEEWSLPSILVETVRWHHEPDKAKQASPVIDVVHVCDLLCLSLGLGIGHDGLQYTSSKAVVERLHITATDVELTGVRAIAAEEELTNALAAA